MLIRAMLEDANQAGTITAGLRGRGTMAATLALGFLGLVSVIGPVAFNIMTHPHNSPIFNAPYMIVYAIALLLSVVGLTVGIVHLSLRVRYRIAVIAGITAAMAGSLCAAALVTVKTYSYYLLFAMIKEFFHSIQPPFA